MYSGVPATEAIALTDTDCVNPGDNCKRFSQMFSWQQRGCSDLRQLLGLPEICQQHLQQLRLSLLKPFHHCQDVRLMPETTARCDVGARSEARHGKRSKHECTHRFDVAVYHRDGGQVLQRREQPDQRHDLHLQRQAVRVGPHDRVPLGVDLLAAATLSWPLAEMRCKRAASGKRTMSCKVPVGMYCMTR